MSEDIPKKNFFNKTPEEMKAWLKKLDEYEEPEGCIACSAIAGCCTAYPNCPGNLNWQPKEENKDGK